MEHKAFSAPSHAISHFSLCLSYRFKDVSLIMKSVQTAMTLRTRFPRTVAGFDLVTVYAARQLFVRGGATPMKPSEEAQAADPGLLRVQQGRTVTREGRAEQARLFWLLKGSSRIRKGWGNEDEWASSRPLPSALVPSLLCLPTTFEIAPLPPIKAIVMC